MQIFKLETRCVCQLQRQDRCGNFHAHSRGTTKLQSCILMEWKYRASRHPSPEVKHGRADCLDDLVSPTEVQGRPLLRAGRCKDPRLFLIIVCIPGCIIIVYVTCPQQLLTYIDVHVPCYIKYMYFLVFNSYL